MQPVEDWMPGGGGPVAAVVAHPDDESFGLGALIAQLAAAGREVRVLCFTHGEASTIGASYELGPLRHHELLAGAAALHVAHVTLLDLPDGCLDETPASELDAHVDAWLGGDIAALLVFEPNGVTGHPDHRAATRAAERVADRRGLPVVEWGLHPVAAARLRDEHGLSFQAIDDGPQVLDIDVDRTAQHEAVRCHVSQLDEDPTVFKRLRVQGNLERVRLRSPDTRPRPGEV